MRNTPLPAVVRRALALAALVVSAAPAPAQQPAGSSKIAAVLQPFVAKGELAGAVALVADKDKVLSVDAVGYSDVAAKTPLKTDAVVWIASMSKPIAGAALMILVDEGKVKIEDPVAKYLPEFNEMWVAGYKDGDTMLLKRAKTPITIRQR